jgi:hypothetical protein
VVTSVADRRGVRGITDAADALEGRCRERGWTVEHIRSSPTFRRIFIRSSSSELLVDLDVFIEMLATLDRYDDTDISDLGAEPAQLRGFVTRWRDQLRASSGS